MSKMSEKFRLDRKIGFQNMFYTKCINVIIDSIGPLIILRSIFFIQFRHSKGGVDVIMSGVDLKSFLIDHILLIWLLLTSICSQN